MIHPEGKDQQPNGVRVSVEKAFHHSLGTYRPLTVRLRIINEAEVTGLGELAGNWF